MEEKFKCFEAQLLEKDREIAYYRKLLEDISTRNLRELEESSRMTAYLKEQERIQQEEHKKKRIESIGLLAGGVAHDLNNILSGIINYPELLLLKVSADSPLRDYLIKIQESGQRAAAVVTDLLTITRGVATPKEVYDINEIVCQYLLSPQHENLMAQYPFIVCRNHLNSTPLYVRCSPVHLTKSLMNLVINAAEAIGCRGEIIVKTASKRDIRGMVQGRYVALQIHDSGTGIEKESISRIFEPFYTKKVLGRSGTGLGLTVVWNTMKDHNGFVEVDSGRHGSRFTLFFPQSDNIMEERSQPEPIAHNLKGIGSILVVDDEENQRDIASAVLTTLGYHVSAVPSGEEALIYLRSRSVDLLLLDMIMEPGMNGRATYQEILKLYPKQKALIVSGFSKSVEVKEACRIGADGFIPKPYTLEQLGRAVQRILVEA
jgi:signal transduction histidine kinase